MNDQLRERMRTNYPPGTRVQLIRMDDPYAPVPSGMRGTVTNAIKLIENALKEARQGAFRVRNCRGFEKMCMPNRRSGDSA